jgi:hypothetical protein
LQVLDELEMVFGDLQYFITELNRFPMLEEFFDIGECGCHRWCIWWQEHRSKFTLDELLDQFPHTVLILPNNHNLFYITHVELNGLPQ